MNVTTPTTAVADEISPGFAPRPRRLKPTPTRNEAAGRLDDRRWAMLQSLGVFHAMAPAEYGHADLAIYERDPCL